MRTLSLLPLAFALTQAAAWAGPQEVQQTEPALSEIQVQAAMPAYKPRPAEINAVKGAYALDNGATLKITHEHNRMYAQLGQGAATELVAVAENKYVAPAQGLTVDYVPIAFGDQIVLSYPADLSMAGSPRVTVTLAAN